MEECSNTHITEVKEDESPVGSPLNPQCAVK